ncbi:MAG: InlB B-repeat-containing protein, partial [Lentisphaerales bacterium]|nr:InlB B-repeat-containing protein [Lentisphaerales bacterium]
QEQESNNQSHSQEEVHYISINFGSFSVDGTEYLVDTVYPVDERIKALSISDFNGFIASDLTYTGGDTTVLRMQGNPHDGVDLIHEEEQSKNDEVKHTNETVAFLAVKNPDIHTVTFAAAANGSLLGSSIQFVPNTKNAETVAAVPDINYQFHQWSDGNQDNPRSLNFVEADIHLTAEFTPVTYTVNFALNGGTLSSGDLEQTVQQSSDAIAPIVTPPIGYSFVGWDADFSNITENLTVTAQYQINSYTVTFEPAPGNYISGELTQVINHGSGAIAPVVVPPTGYTFTGWDTDISNIVSDITITAQYQINSYTVTFDIGTGSVDSGELTQEINHGSSAVAPVVVPPIGYSFTSWDVGFSNITSNITVTAQYSLNSYTVNFTSESNGTLTGETAQAIDHGGSTSEVLAVAEEGYHFTKWSDGNKDNPRTIQDVASDLDLVAEFGLAPILEFGDTVADSSWKTVYFTKTFVDPVVIAGPPSKNDDDFAVVRIKNVTSTGFDIRIQEWDYLDGIHAQERVNFVVAEKGRYTLAGGQEIEVGAFAQTNTGYSTISFDSPFVTEPVVFTTVLTENELDAVTTRIRNISLSSFQNKMQEQESNSSSHASETIAYIAIDSGSTSFEGKSLVVGIQGSVDEVWDDVDTEGHDIFIGGFQTVAGNDTGSMRITGNIGESVQIAFEEEQSKNHEVLHVNETAGFILTSLQKYDVNFSAGANGSIVENTYQVIRHGEDSVPVEAIPATGYHFVEWSNGSTSNPLTLTRVIADTELIAEFAINNHTVTFRPGLNGSITGELSQSVDYGGGTSEVTAVPADGFRFKEWSDGYQSATRVVNTVEEDLTFTALFEFVAFSGVIDSVTETNQFKYVYPYQIHLIDSEFSSNSEGEIVSETGITLHPGTIIHSGASVRVRIAGVSTVNFVASENGGIEGATTQYAETGVDSTSPVTAVADYEHIFVNWSNGNRNALYEAFLVNEDISLTASFTSTQVQGQGSVSIDSLTVYANAEPGVTAAWMLDLNAQMSIVPRSDGLGDAYELDTADGKARLLDLDANPFANYDELFAGFDIYLHAEVDPVFMTFALTTDQGNFSLTYVMGTTGTAEIHPAELIMPIDVIRDQWNTFVMDIETDLYDHTGLQVYSIEYLDVFGRCLLDNISLMSFSDQQ